MKYHFWHRYNLSEASLKTLINWFFRIQCKYHLILYCENENSKSSSVAIHYLSTKSFQFSCSKKKYNKQKICFSNNFPLHPIPNSCLPFQFTLELCCAFVFHFFSFCCYYFDRTLSSVWCQRKAKWKKKKLELFNWAWFVNKGYAIPLFCLFISYYFNCEMLSISNLTSSLTKVD